MTQMVADLLIGVLEQIGVRQVFGLIGDSLNPLGDAVRRSTIEWIGVRHGDGTSKRQRARAPIQKRNLATDFRSLAAIGHWLERPYHLPLGKVN